MGSVVFSSVDNGVLAFALYALAVVGGMTEQIGALLDRLASLPKTPRQAVLLVALVSMLFSLLNWGLSIVGSAVFVRYVARKVKGVDYRLLVASAYLGLGTTWHAGLSASAPLLVATPKHFLEKEIGLIFGYANDLHRPQPRSGHRGDCRHGDHRSLDDAQKKRGGGG